MKVDRFPKKVGTAMYGEVFVIHHRNRYRWLNLAAGGLRTEIRLLSI
jgi:hypothetical protein